MRVSQLESLKLKWIVPSKDTHFKLDATLTSECLLIAKDKQGRVSGFCFFDPRSLNVSFFDKVLSRHSKGDFDQMKLELFYPEFLQHRIDQISTKYESLGLSYTKSSFAKIDLVNGSAIIRNRLKVVNVDDSPVLLKFLKHTFDQMGFVDVVAQVGKSPEATETIIKHNPDIVTLDIQMPEMNGVEVLKELLSKKYFPAIMISSLNLEEGSLVFDALNSGAFDYIPKPKSDEKKLFSEELLKKSLAAIEGKGAHESLKKLSAAKKSAPSQELNNQNYPKNLVWAIGSSTGGTQALTHVFTSMPNNIPPTVIVQHIPPVFSKSFADSLNHLCPFTVKEAEHGELLKPNHVYIAPGGTQMSIKAKGGDSYVIEISDDAPVNRFKPSVDFMFHKLAQIKDLNFVAGILTGMGRDGAAGLLALKNKGSLTFAQDEASSTVYGMPRAAYEIGATDVVVPLDQIATTLLSLSAEVIKKAA